MRLAAVDMGPKRKSTAMTVTAPCPRCGTPVIAGGPRTVLPAVCDATPLTPLGELRAVVAGRWTWTWWTIPDTLHPRDPFVIRHRPAGSRPRMHVLADHACTHLEETRT